MASHHARINIKLDTGIRKAIHMTITKKAVAAAGEDVRETSNDTDSAISVPQPPYKIPRADKNWSDNYQVQRSLNYRDNKVAKLLLKSNDLSKKNESLKGTVHEQKSTIKDLTHQYQCWQRHTPLLFRMQTLLKELQEQLGAHPLPALQRCGWILHPK